MAQNIIRSGLDTDDLLKGRTGWLKEVGLCGKCHFVSIATDTGVTEDVLLENIFASPSSCVCMCMPNSNPRYLERRPRPWRFQLLHVLSACLFQQFIFAMEKEF